MKVIALSRHQITKNALRPERGAILIFTTLIVAVLITFLALAIEATRYSTALTRQHRNADRVALATLRVFLRSALRPKLQDIPPDERVVRLEPILSDALVIASEFSRQLVLGARSGDSGSTPFVFAGTAETSPTFFTTSNGSCLEFGVCAYNGSQYSCTSYNPVTQMALLKPISAVRLKIKTGRAQGHRAVINIFNVGELKVASEVVTAVYDLDTLTATRSDPQNNYLSPYRVVRNAVWSGNCGEGPEI